MVKSKFAQISSLGRFRSKHGKVYLPKPGKGGYCSVDVNRGKRHVHRLVAAAFLGPRERADHTHVEHIDNNRQNNRADNLRWASVCENRNNPISKKNRKSSGPKLSKAVKARRVGEPEWSLRFESVTDAATKLGLPRTSVNACCNMRLKSSGGMEFDFDEPNEPSELPGEEWRAYGPGFSVSSFGRRRNDKNGVVSWGHKRESGHMTTAVGGKSVQVHRVVAEAFELPREPGQDHVDHIDGDPSNNRVENLRWVTGRQNTQVSYHTKHPNRGSNAEQLSQSVEVLRGGEVVGVYPSVTKAAEDLGVWCTHITGCLAGRRTTTGGFSFRKVPAADIVGEYWVDISDDLITDGVNVK